MNPIVKFFHELISPHCEHCEKLRITEIEQREIDREVNNTCRSCENLKMELANAHKMSDKLLEKLTEKPQAEPAMEPVEHKVIAPRNIPWSITRNKLEQESRMEAQRLKALAESNSAKPNNGTIEKLENELGVNNGTAASS